MRLRQIDRQQSSCWQIPIWGARERLNSSAVDSWIESNTHRKPDLGTNWQPSNPIPQQRPPQGEDPHETEGEEELQRNSSRGSRLLRGVWRTRTPHPALL